MHKREINSNDQRVGALDRVRGVAIYAADQTREEMMHGFLVVSDIAKGRLLAIDTTKAEKVADVVLILTHENIGELGSSGFLMSGGYGAQSFQPLSVKDIAYKGQPLALVVAKTIEAAKEGAGAVTATYEKLTFSSTIKSSGAETVRQAQALPQPMFSDKKVGDAEAVMNNAIYTVDSTYDLPAQHQNPIELIATVAEWREDQLTIWEGTQNAEGIRHGLAKQLGITPEKIRVISSNVGGAFGQKNSLQSHTVLVAIASRKLGLPVKLVLTRTQLFHAATFRPASRHRIRLGASQNGHLTAAIHDTEQQTSRHDLYPSVGTDMTSRFYAIRNFSGNESLVRTDIQTPGPMRAPSEQPAGFAFESAVDELAYKLEIDPVELRLKNDALIDPITGKPFTSRHLAACIKKGAQMFQWSKRSMAPRSMRAKNGDLVGWGMAIGAYKAAMAPTLAKVRINTSGQIDVFVGGHEMGQGISTTIARTVSQTLGAPITAVKVMLGDTKFAPQHITAGSWGTATVLPPVKEASERLLEDLRGKVANNSGLNALQLLKSSGKPFAEAESRKRAPGQPEQIFTRLTTGLPAAAGPVFPEFIGFSFVAHYVEVQVEPTTNRVRVSRVVSVVDCGAVISKQTARSQVEGGVVWGIGAALREVSEVDPRYGGFLNADLAEYVVPVAADIGNIEVDFIDIPDMQLNDMGVKGLGEVAMVGVAPAIVNAIFHATGKRIRHLPVRIEDLTS